MEQADAQDDEDARALRMERQLAVPVLVAAAVSVPAVFLVMAGGTAKVIGTVLNWASFLVLAGESLILLLLSHRRYDWIREHKWPLIVTVSAAPAVIFVVGPVQVIRLVLFFSALRVLKVRRIFLIGSIIRDRARLSRRRTKLLFAGLTVLAVIFVIAVLADPDSPSHRMLVWVADLLG